MEIKISKTKIERRLRQKTNSELVGTIIKLKKTAPELAKLLAMPRRDQLSMNLSQINYEAKAGDNILIPGKVLASGKIDKKVKIVAWKFSEEAKKKLKEEKIEFSTITEELNKNHKLDDLRVLI